MQNLLEEQTFEHSVKWDALRLRLGLFKLQLVDHHHYCISRCVPGEISKEGQNILKLYFITLPQHPAPPSLSSLNNDVTERTIARAVTDEDLMTSDVKVARTSGRCVCFWFPSIHQVVLRRPIFVMFVRGWNV